MNELFKIENIAHSVMTLMIVGGITACSLYSDSPGIVAIASMTAFTGFLGSKGLAYYQRSALSKLSYVESTELSFLRQIRARLSRGEEVSSELIEISASAANDSDDAYRQVYGFGRPLPATQLKKG